jgi:hypothetical protein
MHVGVRYTVARRAHGIKEPPLKRKVWRAMRTRRQMRVNRRQLERVEFVVEVIP